MRIATRIVGDVLTILAVSLIPGNSARADSDASDVVVIDKQTSPIRSIGLPKVEDFGNYLYIIAHTVRGADDDLSAIAIV